MAVALVYLVLLLAMTGYSSGATYCVCKDGLSESILQKNIDYACGAGADCTAILQNGGCYNPNTVKDHCNYAVNSYFQKRGQATGSCDFAGTATITQSLTSASSGCVYPSSASSTGTGTTTPSTSTGTTGTTTGTTGTTTTGTTPVFGLGPTGSGGIGSSTDNSSKASVTHLQDTLLFWSLTLLTLFFLGPIFVSL